MSTRAWRRRRILIICMAALVLAVPAAAAPDAASPPETRFRLIPRQPVATGEKIEVIDFFWYGCPHCYNLQPALEQWARLRPPDVVLRRIPAVLRDTWAPHARIFYTLEALGEVDRLHQQVYEGYHVERLRMSRPEVVAEWAVRHGIEREKWIAAYTAPETDLKVEEAKAAAGRYAIRGTPSLVVDGHFLTSSSMAESIPGVIDNLERIIALARAQRSAK